jgi:hypothetical protein
MRILRVFTALLATIAVAELALRLIWGFGTPVLYVANKNYEYSYAPGQDVRRYGNHILTNSYGMRFEEPTSKDSVRVLYLGDSVINGGSHSDQDELSSTLLSNELSAKLQKKVNVMNISAGSWGPDNAAAFLDEHGYFDADAMVIIFSSHDAFDNMTFEPVVGRNVNYPDTKPLCAISEVIMRYLLPMAGNILGVSAYSQEKLMINRQRKVFNKGWKSLIDKAAEKNIPVIAVLHAEKNELKEQHYNRYGRMIIDSLKTRNVPVYTDLEWGISNKEYRDFIHLNAQGQAFHTEKLVPVLTTVLR